MQMRRAERGFRLGNSNRMQRWDPGEFGDLKKKLSHGIAYGRMKTEVVSGIIS